MAISGTQLQKKLLDHGWVYDALTDCMISPAGGRLSMSSINAHPDTMADVLMFDHQLPSPIQPGGGLGDTHWQPGSPLQVRPDDTKPFHWAPILRLKARLDMAPTEDFP